MANDRSSEAGKPVLVSDPQQVARIEAENTLRQFDAAIAEMEVWIGTPGYKLRPSKIMTLNRLALDRLSEYAGTNRPSGIKITDSSHVPPDASQVQLLMEEFCDYVNDEFKSQNAIHLAAYALWKINWIHPFVDGNGRTARIVSYLIMCSKLGYRLPGTRTIPDQIADNKKPYYRALEQADAAFKTGHLDLSALEDLINGHLAVQLLDIHDTAAGKVERAREAVADNLVSASPKPDVVSSASLTWLQQVEMHPVFYTFLGSVILAALGFMLSKFA
ncbi:Fic/DOC family protein [Rhizobium sp. PP-F2F-G36]|nr:Fic/DOC family protein [Rhizobium sp. PP-F2F-G36]